MPTYAVPGDTKEDREKFVKWILGENQHVKMIQEVFKKGNSWIEVNFDCEYSRDAAMDRIKEKEGDWLKLIPEESKDARPRHQRQPKDTYRKEEVANKKMLKTEDKKKLLNKHSPTEKESYSSILTIWDLLANINREEV